MKSLKKHQTRCIRQLLIMVMLTVGNAVLLTGCFSYSLPKGPQNSASHDQKLADVLSTNKGNILSPADANDISLSISDVPKNYRVMKHDGKSWTYDFLYKLGEYYYYKTTSSSAFTKPYRMRTNGKSTSHSYSADPFHLRPAPSGACKFVLGECKYIEDDGDITTVTNSYQDGIWTTKREIGLRGIGTRVDMEVYDKRGFSLFSSTSYTSDPDSYSYYFREPAS
ncbi:hypothetical protein [Thalassospira indica]|nr:hypothetical protein [Thalassospira indica]OAZ14038.1 hypothetical protein TH15_07315 [Thalassospira profundimaris]